MMTFNHENLQVYQRTLPFNSKVFAWTSQWDSKHAIGDHLPRSAGSILENIAMASAAFSRMKTRSLDYAVGSCLECAACLDIACIKRLLDANMVCSEKEELSQILRMLVGLRTSWTKKTTVAREDHAKYEVRPVADKDYDKVLGKKVFFHHEKLDVYRVAIAAAEAFCSSESVSGLPNPVFRRLDELLTSMVLNIAEGNGRFSDADQARFLGTSHESTIKMAARLDLCVSQCLLQQNEVSKWKILLERVSFMTSAMIRRLQS